MGEFFRTHVGELKFVPLTDEQPLKNHAIYEAYVEMVDTQLTQFLLDEGIEAEGCGGPYIFS
ncbi:hypothetical protein FOA52_000497 [Chlamydomonas sp. UWO 241]|nr:hypothetical protein FOA52_000497 [Chlamydomonas sp. UWO 241]